MYGQKRKQDYLTGRSEGQDEAGEEEEEEEDIWAGLEGVGADGTIFAVVKVHCLVVWAVTGDCKTEKMEQKEAERRNGQKEHIREI